MELASPNSTPNKIPIKQLRLGKLFALMIGLALILSAFTAWRLYDTGLKDYQVMLSEFAHSQARLIGAVGRFDAKYSESDHPEGAFGATLSQVGDALESFALRETGEILIAVKEQSDIKLLYPSRFHTIEDNPVVDSGDPVHAILTEALTTGAGSTFFTDHRNEPVLAAFEPVAGLDIAIVFKIDLKEIRAPYINALFTISIGAMLLIALAFWLFRLISKPALQQLLNRIHLTQAAGEAADIGIWIGHADNKTMSFDDNIRRMLGVEDNSISVRDFVHMVHRDDRAIYFDSFKQALATHEVISATYRIKRLDGKTIFVFVRGRYSDSLSKDGRHFVGTMQDGLQRSEIEHRQFEQQRFENFISRHSEILRNCDATNVRQAIRELLRESGEGSEVDRLYFTRYVDNGETLLDAQGWIRKGTPDFGNRDSYRSMRDSPTFLYNYRNLVTAAINLPTDSHLLSPGELESLIERSTVAIIQVPIASNDTIIGSLFAESTTKEVNWSKTEINRLRIIGDLIGNALQRVDRETTLRRQALVFEEMVEATIITNGSGRIIDMNQAAERMCGRSQNECIGEFPFDVVTLHEVEKLAEEFVHNPKTSISYMKKVKFTRHDGAEITTDAVVIPLPGFSETNLTYLIVVQDITQRALAEQALIDHRDQLEDVVSERTAELAAANTALSKSTEEALAANAAKSEFLARMSHELRTPLNAIIGISEMIEEDAQEDGHDTYVEPLVRVHSAGRYLLTLIDDILDLSKVEAGRVELNVEEIHLQSFFNEIVSTSQPLARKNNNELALHLNDVPETIHSDPIRMRQVLLNLMSNACKFTHDGHITITATMTQQDNEQMLRCHVVDDGIGIPEEKLPNMFEEFTRAHDDEQYQGTGLGLSISRSLTKLLGGQISIESAPNVGTTLTATFDTNLTVNGMPSQPDIVSAREA